ncbi:hypothetical protein P7C70_g7886, partial [Phenoliferia sp. Uapishka_3]
MDALFPLNTATVVLSGAGVVASTFVRNLFHQQNGVGKEVQLRSELLYDECFSVMKAFFEKASLHTIEDLQKFGNNWVPAPFWVRIVSVTIPLSTRLAAGRVLIKTLGEEEMDKVIGGKEWWQRSANESGGITGEWISMKKDWQGLDAEEESEEHFDKIRVEKLQKMKEDGRKKKDPEVEERKREEKERKKEERRARKEARAEDDAAADLSDASDDEDSEPTSPTGNQKDNHETYSAEMDEMRCLLYIHGGAYFFGSINTHRYSIWRYARKMGGRAFAIHYRLAPQYPFPCALSDALASYLYLIRPPPEAKHKPVDPAKLTLAGDSAGGGLCLALLCLIRDAGLPAPAGAMLISPWCDLTHSFPSILTNTATDITPPYGFLFKPSTLWPPPPPSFQARANASTSLSGLIKASDERKLAQETKAATRAFSVRRKTDSKAKELAKEVHEGRDGSKDLHGGDPRKAEGEAMERKQDSAEAAKEMRVKVDGVEVVVDSQIQLYATNDQMAHRAANPEAFPLRQALLDANPERAAKAKMYPPTKVTFVNSLSHCFKPDEIKKNQVHLQIYDDCCHDLPLLSFTTPAKYCYRAISSFAKFVTADKEPTSTHSGPSTSESSPPSSSSPTQMRRLQSEGFGQRPLPSIPPPSPPPVATFLQRAKSLGSRRSPSMKRRPSGLGSAKERKKAPPVPQMPSSPKPIPHIEETIYSSTDPFNRPPWVDNMVRERVAIDGVVRKMEPKEEMYMLKLDPEDLGKIKEGPVKRYLAGSEFSFRLAGNVRGKKLTLMNIVAAEALWDKRFKRAYEHVEKRREHHLKKSMAEEALRIRKRMAAEKEKKERKREASGGYTPEGGPSPARTASPEQMEVFEGIWNLHGEHPPPSSIAARKDTREARKLAHVLDTRYGKLHALHLWNDMILIETSLDFITQTLQITIPSTSSAPSSTHTIPFAAPHSAPRDSYSIWGGSFDGIEVGTPELLEALSTFMAKPVLLILKGETPRPAGVVTSWRQSDEVAGIYGEGVEKPTTMWSDMCPILIVSEESRKDVAGKIELESRGAEASKGFDKDRWVGKEDSLEIERWRGNIVVEGVGEPWEEDGWKEVVFVGEGGEKAEMFISSRCARCMLPNVDPASGIRDKVVPG